MSLSKIQQKIVDCKDRNIIVDAGSGSGKTRTLTERVKRILSSGVNPKSVVVITFTNMAANELYSRLENVPGIDKCFIGTIHSYANSLLKKTGYEYDIFSESYQTQFAIPLIEKYGYYCKKEDYELFVKLERLVNSGKMSAKEVANHFTSSNVLNEILYILGRQKSYKYPVTVETMCEANHIVTFDKLLELATEYFNEAKTAIDYLFVDELQDIGDLEYNFLMKLNAKNNFFIGDDYQSIFGFKGGNVQIFLSLMNNKDWTVFYLTENYRTATSILMLANTVIQKAKDIIVKTVEPMRKEQGSIEFMAQSNFNNLINSIKPGEQWFILTRTNKELSIVQAKLKELKRDFATVRKTDLTAKQLHDVLSGDKIKVMTVHSSKGLECDNVALFGKFPIKNQNDSDEIKVFYVGLTRAKDRCVIFI